jgi:hypothetical protein
MTAAVGVSPDAADGQPPRLSVPGIEPVDGTVEASPPCTPLSTRSSPPRPLWLAPISTQPPSSDLALSSEGKPVSDRSARGTPL